MAIAAIGFLACYIAIRLGIDLYPAVFRSFAGTHLAFTLPDTVFGLLIGLFLAALLSVPMLFLQLGLDVLIGIFIRKDISLGVRVAIAITAVAGSALLAFAVPLWIIAAAAGIVVAYFIFTARRAPT